ncbi:MAG: calcium/sodium antiporter [Candidatus Thorarchaeota archaeon]|nr:MAG: calcium/sodium antiporter [Candidatus Thorarchaeota archaeon]
MQSLAAIFNVGLLALGLIMLSQGSEYFVETASKLARSAGISELFIGLTLVAVGTSLPEIVSSSLAVVAGSAYLAFGNVLGSYIANLTLVIGLSAVLAPLASNAALLGRDSKVMIFILLFLGFSMFDPVTPAQIVAYEGVVLLLLFVAYVLFLYDNRDECETCYQFEVFVDYLIRLRFLTTLQGLARKSHATKSKVVDSNHEEEHDESAQQKQLVRPYRDSMIVILSCLGVVVGAQFVIQGATHLSLFWGVNEGLIGLTVVALGTSLPEIMVSVNSARKGFGRLLIGNVIGSNIINITLGLGIGVLAVSVSIDMLTAGLLMGLSLAISTLFYFVIKVDWRVTRREGVLLILCYVFAQIAVFSILQLGGV